MRILFWIVALVQMFFSIFQIKYLIVFWRQRKSYPIKQLSPSITVIQQIIFLTMQINLIASIFKSNNLQFYQDCYNNEINIDFGEGILQFIYLFQRGCVVSFSSLKTLRICYAYQNKLLNERSVFTKILKNEKILILVGLFYGILVFPLATFLTTKLRFHYSFQCNLYVYEHNYFYVIIFNLLEEFFVIGLMFLLQARHTTDKLYRLTFNVQFLYLIWYSITSLLTKFGSDQLNTLIELSYWIRSQLMFYFYVYQPVQLKEDFPSVYITKAQILDFKILTSKSCFNFYHDDKLWLTFEQYLIYLDRSLEQIQFIKNKEFSKISQFELYKAFHEIQNLINSTDNLNNLDRLGQLFKKSFDYYNEFPNTNEFYNQLTNHFLNIYQDGFCRTKAFQGLFRYYLQNTILQENLKILGIQLKQYDPLDSKF